MSYSIEINYDLLKNSLNYCIETGIFTRRVSGQKYNVNDIATTNSGHGYLSIWINGYRYLAHRLAWYYVHKTWPPHCIDHINGNRKDNRLANLRLATKSQNNQNSKHRVNNTSGYKGVSWHKRDKCWRVKCSVGGIKHDVGAFKSLTDAVNAYKGFAQINHKEFYANDNR